jgi:alpha-tubulin suppressor-like RCC1 family protein
VTTSGGQTCVTLGDGTARCWGDDTPDHAQLWTECPEPRTHQAESPRDDGSWVIGPVDTYCVAPAPIGGLSGVLQVVPGSLHACALLRDGTVRCWGSNFYGAIGDGTGGGLEHDRAAPTPVAL